MPAIARVEAPGGATVGVLLPACLAMPGADPG
jgi:hypothetical protein